ncbi:MAG: DNA-binding protein [Verrucomicrobia bacterium]|nr:MAG: DNA-binding protein [Verrucomicrobiota bacterium]
MMETVYIETSVVSYLTARPSRDLVVAAHQQITHEWWDNVLFKKYEPCISEEVVREASYGDFHAADLRLSASAKADAVHLAASVLNSMDYLVSWNCRHIANGHVIKLIQAENQKRGLVTPVICTPEELLEN